MGDGWERAREGMGGYHGEGWGDMGRNGVTGEKIKEEGEGGERGVGDL